MNAAQGEAVLDVFEHCSVVTAARNQLNLVTSNTTGKTKKGKAVKADVLAAYREALDHLVFLFSEAKMLGADETIICGILLERLPTSTLKEVMDLVGRPASPTA